MQYHVGPQNRGGRECTLQWSSFCNAMHARSRCVLFAQSPHRAVALCHEFQWTCCSAMRGAGRGVKRQRESTWLNPAFISSCSPPSDAGISDPPTVASSMLSRHTSCTDISTRSRAELPTSRDLADAQQARTAMSAVTATNLTTAVPPGLYFLDVRPECVCMQRTHKANHVGMWARCSPV